MILLPPQSTQEKRQTEGLRKEGIVGCRFKLSELWEGRVIERLENALHVTSTC